MAMTESDMYQDCECKPPTPTDASDWDELVDKLKELWQEACQLTPDGTSKAYDANAQKVQDLLWEMRAEAEKKLAAQQEFEDTHRTCDDCEQWVESEDLAEMYDLDGVQWRVCSACCDESEYYSSAWDAGVAREEQRADYEYDSMRDRDLMGEG